MYYAIVILSTMMEIMFGLKFVLLIALILTCFTLIYTKETGIQLALPDNSKSNENDNQVQIVNEHIDIILRVLKNSSADTVKPKVCEVCSIPLIDREEETMCYRFNNKCAANDYTIEKVIFDDYERGRDINQPMCKDYFIKSKKEFDIFERINITTSVESVKPRSLRDGSDIDEDMLEVGCENMINETNLIAFGGPANLEVQQSNEVNTSSLPAKKRSFFNECLLPEIIPERFLKLLKLGIQFINTEREKPVEDAKDANGEKYFNQNAFLLKEIRSYLEPIYEILHSIQTILESETQAPKVDTITLAQHELIKNTLNDIKSEISNMAYVMKGECRPKTKKQRAKPDIYVY